MTHRTKRALDFAPTRYYPAFTLPAHTPVHLVKGASGTHGDLWAVTSARTIMDLTGNTHDPKYRYFWINAAEVEEAPRS